MHVIHATNINEAYFLGLDLLNAHGVKQESRAGNVLVTPFPVTTVYQYPMQRVLFDAQRDANPFFHLFEALWMLAGRDDATWLDQFVKDYSARFAEEGGIQHGAYGFRWRKHFGVYGRDGIRDQLTVAVNLLKENPNDRRVVIQMWDPEVDLAMDVKDCPCNLCILPRIVNGRLDITVFCRSNDLIWGVYGANAVHFSVLQEYLAARIGVQMGKYCQISNNFHAYEDIFNKKTSGNFFTNSWNGDPYDSLDMTPIRLVTEPEEFDTELEFFFEDANYRNYGAIPERHYHNHFFPDVALPMFYSFKAWREGEIGLAGQTLSEIVNKNGDWYQASLQWFQRRQKAQEARSA